MKPFLSPAMKKLTHARSTPDLSSIPVDNPKDDSDDTSSSLENLSNAYSTKTLSTKRPPGSILKRKTQQSQPPPPLRSKIQEEPVYVSSAIVPLQQSKMRAVQSMTREQNTSVSER